MNAGATFISCQLGRATCFHPLENIFNKQYKHHSTKNLMNLMIVLNVITLGKITSN